MLRPATIEEKEKTYEWLCLSDTTSLHMGPPDFPENPVLGKGEFMDNFEDFYYTENERDKGGILIISVDGEEIGCACYTCFHLRPQRAELDIWLKGRKYCGKGYGMKATQELISYLNENMGISKFIIRPSEKNISALESHKKIGFRPVANKYETVREYIKPELLEEYGNEDYGVNATAVLTLEL